MRYILAVLLLPFVVTVLVPLTILQSVAPKRRPFARSRIWVGTGLGFLLSGIWLLAVTIKLFACLGEGTLAPWDPPKKLVVKGPYRYVRNPMIIGVLAVLLGEAFLFGSGLLFLFAAVFAALNHYWFIHVEEPQLLKRFGEDYRHYTRHVPRWIPNIKPYSHKNSSS